MRNLFDEVTLIFKNDDGCNHWEKRFYRRLNLYDFQEKSVSSLLHLRYKVMFEKNWTQKFQFYAPKWDQLARYSSVWVSRIDDNCQIATDISQKQIKERQTKFDDDVFIKAIVCLIVPFSFFFLKNKRRGRNRVILSGGARATACYRGKQEGTIRWCNIINSWVD